MTPQAEVILQTQAVLHSVNRTEHKACIRCLNSTANQKARLPSSADVIVVSQ